MPVIREWLRRLWDTYRDGNHVFSDLFGLAPLTTESRTGEDPIAAEVVTDNFFQSRSDTGIDDYL